jgi:hypothetical protein
VAAVEDPEEGDERDEVEPEASNEVGVVVGGGRDGGERRHG